MLEILSRLAQRAKMSPCGDGSRLGGGGLRPGPFSLSLDFSAVQAAEAKLPGSWQHFMNHCESRDGGGVGKGHWRGEPWSLEKERSLSLVSPIRSRVGACWSLPDCNQEITEGGSPPCPVISTKQPLPGHPFHFACSPGTSRSPWPTLLGESSKDCSR